MEDVMSTKIFKQNIFIIFLFLIASCSFPEQELIVDVHPQLIEQYPLPRLPYPLKDPEFKLFTRLLLSEKGEVLSAKLINSSWDSDWDSAAIKQLMKWRFSPAIYDGNPITIWIKQPVLIKSYQNVEFYLAELVCNDKGAIDSIYVLLKGGESFENLAEKFSTSKSKENRGILGKIDIRSLQYFIQNEVRKLAVNSITPPIKVGSQFYIYKRIRE
jgi:TonB family protein